MAQPTTEGVHGQAKSWHPAAVAGALALCALLAGCVTPGGTKFAVDVQTVEKIVAVPCKIEWPAPPREYVAQVQLSGSPAVDALLVSRAAEAELESRIAYEGKLVAAMIKCAETPPPPQ